MKTIEDYKYMLKTIQKDLKKADEYTCKKVIAYWKEHEQELKYIIEGIERDSKGGSYD